MMIKFYDLYDTRIIPDRTIKPIMRSNLKNEKYYFPVAEMIS